MRSVKSPTLWVSIGAIIIFLAHCTVYGVIAYVAIHFIKKYW